jgi:hypothetical protein
MEERLGARKGGAGFHFRAFGEECVLGPEGVTLSGKSATGPRGLLVCLYAIRSNRKSLKIEPLRAFKDLPGSMPYHGAFNANSERVLLPYVDRIGEEQERIKRVFDSRAGISGQSGDFSFVLFPLPKIALCYIFYLEDDEFSPSATCLFSANALSFMPLDGLADVAEYTSRRIIQLVREQNELIFRRG